MPKFTLTAGSCKEAVSQSHEKQLELVQARTPVTWTDRKGITRSLLKKQRCSLWSDYPV